MGGVAVILFAISQLLVASAVPARPAADTFEYPLTTWKPHCLGFGSEWRYCDGTPLRQCASGAVWLHTGTDIKAAVGAPVPA